MLNFILFFMSIGLGYFILRDLSLGVDSFNAFATDPKYNHILIGLTELVRTIILSLFLIVLWLVRIALYLGGILEEKAHVLGQGSEGTAS